MWLYSYSYAHIKFWHDLRIYIASLSSYLKSIGKISNWLISIIPYGQKIWCRFYDSFTITVHQLLILSIYFFKQSQNGETIMSKLTSAHAYKEDQMSSILASYLSNLFVKNKNCDHSSVPLHYNSYVPQIDSLDISA